MIKRKLVTWLVVLLVVTAAWWALLGWDDDYSSGGPYSAWQVVLYVLILAALVVWFGLRGTPIVGSGLFAIATTVNFSVSASATDNSGLWAVGALLVLVGSLSGGLVVAAFADHVAARRRDTLSASRHTMS